MVNNYKRVTKKLVLIVIFLVASLNLNANIEVRLNKLTASIIFTEALLDKSNRPKELKKLFQESKYYKNKNLSIELEKIKPIYKKLRVSKIYGHSKTNKLFSAIMIESVFSDDINSLQNTILSYSLGIDKMQLNKYFATIKKFIPIYEELIWNPSYLKLQRAKEQIENLTIRLKYLGVFKKVEDFYKVNSKEIRPFFITLYPIPGGTSFKALRIENTSPVGIIIREKKINLEWFYSAVVFHEQCHEYFAQYKKELENLVKKYDIKDEKKFIKIFDESVQSSISAGYTYKKLTKGLAENRWYNNKIYDKLAKTIFKDITKYLDNNKSIDEDLITKIIYEYKKLKGI